MKSYKAFLFDLDGTLLDSKKDIAVATNETIAHMGGQRLSEAHIATFVGHGVRDLIRQAIAGSHSASKEDEALKFFTDFYLAHCLDHTKLFAYGREAIEDLHAKGAKLAVLTNKPQVYTDKILSGLGLTNYFEIIVGAESGYPNKPARPATEAILNHLNVPASQALMVGDSVVDLQTGENVGMDCALALNGFSTREEILALKVRAKYLYEDLSFLMKLPVK